jgi:hypothetical protein
MDLSIMTCAKSQVLLYGFEHHDLRKPSIVSLWIRASSRLARTLAYFSMDSRIMICENPQLLLYGFEQHGLREDSPASLWI